MNEKLIIKYKTEIEMFLSTMNIFKSNSIKNIDKELNTKNKKFIIDKIKEINSGNVDMEALEMAVDELLPYLGQF